MIDVHRPAQGFTLLELLVTLTLIAILSTVGLFAYEGTQDEAKVDTTRFEMQEIKRALLQFRADNGAFPCTVYNESPRPYQLVIADMLPLSFPAGLNDTAGDEGERRAWCESNALQMLRIFPFDERDNDPSTGSYIDDVAKLHPLWNPDNKRGWRGPYLSSDEALKDAWGNSYELYDLELDFHPQRKYCDMTANFGECRGVDDTALTVPYNPVVHVVPGNIARLVSGGPDGKIGVQPAYPADGDDPVPDYCKTDPNNSDAFGRDDIVVCLLQ